MIKFTKYLFLMFGIIAGNNAFCANPPIGMQPAAAGVVSGNNWTNFVLKQNVKTVETGNSKVSAVIYDLSNSMTDGHKRIITSTGLIPMIVAIKNDSDNPINISANVLKYNLGISADKAIEIICKNFQFKKYGAYTAITLFYTFVTISAITMAYYTPFGNIAELGKDFVGILAPATYSVLSFISAIPGAKFAMGAGALYWGLNHLYPSRIMDFSNWLTEKYMGVKGNLKSPFTCIDEFNKIEKLLNENKNETLTIQPQTTSQLLTFVRASDAQGILANPATKFPELEIQ